MKVTIGKAGLEKSWQGDFPETTECCRCKAPARIGFVAHEALDPEDKNQPHENYVNSLHENDPKGEGFWLHDCCAVAVYFCTKCLETTALYNQA